MRYFVTGGAGFLGSHLIDRLLRLGNEVVAYDNMSTGSGIFLENAKKSRKFKFVKGDTLDYKSMAKALAGSDLVFHLAANADLQFGTRHPHRGFEQNTVATLNVLEAMRRSGVSRIAFTSTSAIYGEPDIFPTPEDHKLPVQTSLYGASKLAGEGFIQAYCEGFGFQAYIFRPVSMLGERYTHGHVVDFYAKLLKSPDELSVLGDGHQRKSYIYVQDCLDAMFTIIEKAGAKVNIYNIGTDEYCEVNDSIRWISDALRLSPALKYSGGTRGWIGDSPFVLLDTKKVRSLGWKPKVTIKQAITRTIRYLRKNRWILEYR